MYEFRIGGPWILMKIIASFTGLLIRGLKYSVFGGVLSVAAPRGSSTLGRRNDETAEGGRETLLVLSIIRREDRHPFWTLYVPRVALADHI